MFRYKWLSRQLPLLERADHLLSRFLTPWGKTLVIATFCFLLGASHLDTPVYQLFGASASLLLIAWVGVLIYRPRLKCRTRAPALVSCGQPFPLKLIAGNVGNRVACDLTFTPVRESLNESHLACDSDSTSFHSIAVGKHVSVDWSITAQRRGVFPRPRIRMRSSFPFNLIHVSQYIDPLGEIVVAPNSKPLRRLQLLHGAAGHKMGDWQKRLIQGSDQFVGSREYFPGLPARRWDYRAWARLGKPHIRQFEAETSGQVALILDLSLCSQVEIAEAAISLTMSIATELLEKAVAIGLLKVGNRALYLKDVAPSRQLFEIAVHLARIDLRSEADSCSTLSLNDPHESFAYLILPVAERIDTAALRSVVDKTPANLPIVVAGSEIDDTGFECERVLVRNILEGTA